MKKQQRKYMSSDIGTTIIENEKGEEQSIHGDKANNTKESESQKDITMMDQQLEIKSNEMNSGL